MADADFTLPSELKASVESMDCISQSNAEKINTLLEAIGKIVNDQTVKSMLTMIQELSDDSVNEVNAMAEQLGANFKAA